MTAPFPPPHDEDATPPHAQVTLLHMKLYLLLAQLALLIVYGVLLTAVMGFWWVPILAVGLIWQVHWMKRQRPQRPGAAPRRR